MRRLLPVLLALAACESAPSDPLRAALPPLPPEGGPVLTAAGRLTEANFEAERVPGPASLGLVGDFFLRNDQVRVVLQAPGRAIGPCPFGGNVIDLDFVTNPHGDQLGEVSAFLQLGRTFNALSAEVVRDGSRGGPAVIRFFGRDAWNDFINLRGLGSFTSIVTEDGLPSVPLDWEMAVTYVLMPGEKRVRVSYTFYNPGSRERATTWGTLSDTGADVEVFHPRTGFGEVGFEAILGSGVPLTEYAAIQGHGLAYGIVPIFEDPTVRGAAVPIAGVNVEVYGISSLFDAFDETGRSLRVPAGGTAGREIAILLGRDVGEISAEASALRGQATLALEGQVTGDSAAGARVAVRSLEAKAEEAITSVFVADEAGRFTGKLPAGRYELQAEGAALLRSPPVEVTLPASGVALSLSALATVRYTIHDRAGEAIPGRVVAIGARATQPSTQFRDVGKDPLPYGFVAWSQSLTGVSRDDFDPLSGADRPLRLPPGSYRFVFSRGPEWSRDDRVLVVPPEGLTIDATLDHVVPTPGYAACDFHQHTNRSPDAPVAPEARVLSYVAEGIDFASTSEHDVVFDLRPTMQAVGATGLFDTAPGIETTTWDYGHYIGFPLVPDARSPNGGALDWAGGENLDGMGLNLPPPVIFDRLHEAGAKIVQVTHPRSQAGAFTDFQSSFDRVGLHFDFAQRSFYGDAQLMPLDAALLGLPPDVPLFSTGFDTLEIYNGFYLTSSEGERRDVRVDLVLRDWMNFLSFGFITTPTGVSDTHSRIADPAGMPRTLVAVPDDSPAAVGAGLRDQIVATLRGEPGRDRDVVVTNGPFLGFTVDGQRPGHIVAHPSGPLVLHVEVHTTSWAAVDTIEIFANASFDVPGDKMSPLAPSLCFTSKAQPTSACQAAIGGARPMPETLVETVAGVPASLRRDVVIDVSVTVEELLARGRAGAVGKDLWLVARAHGEDALYPSVPNAVSKASVETLVAGTPLREEGVPPLAFTSAVFVDADGAGWRAPFAP